MLEFPDDCMVMLQLMLKLFQFLVILIELGFEGFQSAREGLDYRVVGQC